MKSISSVSALLAATAAAVLAQGCEPFLEVRGAAVTIYGSVDSAGQVRRPLEEVEVALEADSEHAKHHLGATTTDHSGRYIIHLRGHVRGDRTYYVTFRKPGYAERTVNFDSDTTSGVEVNWCGVRCRTINVVLTPEK